MKLIYIAGPYRAKTAWEIDCNIHRARVLGAEVCKLGAYAVIPHSNTAHFDGIAPDEFWLDGTIELMRRCDAVMFTEDWERSSGSRAERGEAMDRNIPRFYDLAELAAWLKEGA